MISVATKHPRSVAVLGAGIVGSAAALALASQGHAVTLIDRAPAGAGTSSGNAGGIVEGAVLPTSTPDVLRALPSYLMDRNSAAHVRPAYFFKVLPWLMRFVAAGRPARVAEIAAALAPLVLNAMRAHRDLTRLCQREDLVQTVGWLKVYASRADFEKSRLQRELMTRHDVNFTELSADEVHDLEPKLNRTAYTQGLFQPGSGFVNHPRALVEAYFAAALQRQARYLQQNVLQIAAVGSTGVSVITDSGTHPFDAVVIAMGAWSGQFAAQLGDKVCLDTERGYHISLQASNGPLLTRPVGFPARDCVISPMHDGICVCSIDELAGLNAPPDFRRIRALLPFVRSVLPAASLQPVQREWMGYRPSTPDSLPVIGRSTQCQNVFYAFGHGHLGLTLSALTAELITGMVNAEAPPFDLTPYRINRF